MPDDQDIAYCSQQVRQYDRDRYLSGLFAPAERRPALYALWAFNLEIAKTRESVSEPMLGQIRLQWWRDTIEGIYRGDVRRHQVASELGRAIETYDLPQSLFQRLVDAREFDLTDEQPPDLPALEAYAEESAAPLCLLALDILGGASNDALQAARHGAIAVALTGLLRATPFHLNQGRCYLPADLVHRHQASQNAITTPAMAKAVASVADRAVHHLAEARQYRVSLPKAALPVLLPVTLAGSDLNKLERADYNLFDPKLSGSPVGRQMRLLAAALRRRY